LNIIKVFAKKEYDHDFYVNWNKIYEKALISMNDRASEIRKAYDMLEKEMEFIGVTGVEDK